MTILTVPAMPGRRSLPWHRMAWVTWRQHRLALAGVAALFGVASAYLLITGLRMRAAYAAVAECRPAGSPICRQVAGDFLANYAPGTGATLALLQVIPALVGAFAAAPILARELETGTFRYTWTQGFGRTRWVVAKLIPLAVTVTITAAAFSQLVSWYVRPIFAAGDENGPLYPTLFDLRGIALAAWTLAAFAIGALAGVLLRKVIPAMFATLVVWSGLAFLAGAVLREHYATPVTTTSPDVPTGTWLLSQDWIHNGQPADLTAINRALRAVDIQAVTPRLFEPGPATRPGTDPITYLIQHGFTLRTSYQPADRFWPFQWIEGGWLLALSLLLIGTTIWLVRRRAA